MLPNYLKLTKNELKKRADKAWAMLSACQVCPRKCGVNRSKEEKGFCQTGSQLIISSFGPHYGEEAPLVGTHGSGTIFFTSCNLACVYCQNYEISQLRLGNEVEIKDLAGIMVNLQNQDCHNINLVSPTIWVPHILKALIIAIDKGLNIPLVYNTGGYASVSALKLLDNIIDIYMPDIKYSDSKIAKKYSQVDNYWGIVQKAVKEMHDQVGDLIIDKNGIAQKGLLIRHLILPNNIAGTDQVINFLASLSQDTYINIMDQYYPAHKAYQFLKLNRRLTLDEYKKAVAIAKSKGLRRFDKKI
jgi:putative pyruvate formate lyase activating enzyme